MLASSTANQINITASFIAENMGATTTARAARYTHVFKVSSSLYSYVLESGFTDIGQYLCYLGCKFDKLAIKEGNDKELTAQIDIVAANLASPIGTTSMDATPELACLHALPGLPGRDPGGRQPLRYGQDFRTEPQ